MVQEHCCVPFLPRVVVCDYSGYASRNGNLGRILALSGPHLALCGF